jgi:hypothetical protein
MCPARLQTDMNADDVPDDVTGASGAIDGRGARIRSRRIDLIRGDKY